MFFTQKIAFNPSKARALQEYLNGFVKIEPVNIDSVEIVVGVDIGYKNCIGIGAAVVYDIRKQKEVCHVIISSEIFVPYIPGLLAFREAPLILAAVKEIKSRCIDFDVIMVNGHGLAHPRKFGISSHIGVVLDKPSIGVAKKLLYGDIVSINGREAIFVDGVKIGYVIGSTSGGKIFVSVGHRITPDNALTIVEITLNKKFSLPEPLRIADNLTKKYKKLIKFNSILENNT